MMMWWHWQQYVSMTHPYNYYNRAMQLIFMHFHRKMQITLQFWPIQWTHRVSISATCHVAQWHLIVVIRVVCTGAVLALLLPTASTCLRERGNGRLLAHIWGSVAPGCMQHGRIMLWPQTRMPQKQEEKTKKWTKRIGNGRSIDESTVAKAIYKWSKHQNCSIAIHVYSCYGLQIASQQL